MTWYIRFMAFGGGVAAGVFIVAVVLSVAHLTMVPTPECWHGRTIDSGFHSCEDPQAQQDRVEDRR